MWIIVYKYHVSEAQGGATIDICIYNQWIDVWGHTQNGWKYIRRQNCS